MEATVQSGQFDLGHWVLRLIALIIDSVILFIVAAIISFIGIIGLISAAALGFWAFGGGWLLLVLIEGVLAVLYFLVLDVAWQGTVGKRVLGLRVQTVNGGRINYSQSFIRNISKIFPLFLLLDWLIGIATPGDRRQKFTDRMAGVTVIQVSQAFAAVSPPPSASPPSQPPPPPPSQ
jgi:uncharacterized RDD family membrane protein YckC